MIVQQFRTVPVCQIGQYQIPLHSALYSPQLMSLIKFIKNQLDAPLF
jgi:hypothetical protein